MEAFRPKELPLGSRLVKNWMFQAAVLILTIATALSFLRVQRDRDVENFADLARPLPQQTTLEAPPPPLSSEAPPTDAAPTAQSVARAIGTPPSTTNARPLAEANARLRRGSPAQPVAGAAAQARGARTGVANSDSVFTQIDLVYAEVPATVVANLEASSRMLEATTVSAGVYPNIAPLMRQLATGGTQVRALRTLESARGLTVRINQPIITFKGMRDPQIDRNVGLTSQIIPTGMDENGLHFQIEIQRTLREPGSQTGVQEFSYQAEISLTKGSGAFITGLIPRRQLEGQERAIYSNASVLKIMASPDFQQGFSEFVLFIEAR